MSEWSYIARLPGYDATTCIHCWYRVIDGRLEVHEYKGNLGLNETSHVGAPIGDSIELQPGEGARELAWQSRTKTRTATSLCRGTRPSCPGDYRK